MRIELEVGEDGKVELKNLTFAELLAWLTAHGLLLLVETSGRPGCGGFKVSKVEDPSSFEYYDPDPLPLIVGDAPAEER